MTDARWTRLADLVPDALALDADARGAFLDAACRAADGTPDAALRTEAERLVIASAEANRAGALASPLARLSGQSGALPERVGPWRVTGVLGEGGMGVVYRAERADGRFGRAVALKVVRHPGRALALRFDRERRALALLEHAHIARPYDAGVDGATPYLAMELVEGAPLTAEADRLGLDVEARVRLVLQACEAVAYAHGRLVLHRDLKPSNVLVTETAQGPRAVVLDFGIARLLGDDGDALTQTGGQLFTPAYAAPEQLAGGEITVATDVYGLGALLYETLAGSRPYALDGVTAAETERRKEAPPRPPSATAGPHARSLRGDLDTICLKALDPDPARRYASAEALADDLQRHLGGLPVDARPATVGYRAGRFVRRHRTSVTAAALVALALVVGLGTALAERDRALRAATEAEVQTERAEAVAGFLEEILRAPNPRWHNDASAPGGPETPIRAVIDQAAARVDADFADRPDLLADLHHVLGDTYAGLGLMGEAARHHNRVLALRESLYTPPDPRLAEALFYAASFLPTAEVATQARMLERAVAMQRERPEGNNFPFLMDALGYLYGRVGRAEEADALFAEGIAFAERRFVPGADGARYRDRVLVSLLANRAEALLDLGRLGDAERELDAADSLIARLPRTAAYAEAWTITSCHRGRLLRLRRQFAQAEPLLHACAGEAPPRGAASPFPVASEAPFRSDPLRALAGAERVALYDAWGRPAKADPYRADAARHAARRDSIRALYRAPAAPLAL